MDTATASAEGPRQPTRCIRLTRGTQAEKSPSRLGVWEETLERIVHRSIQSLWTCSAMDLSEVEGLAFLEALIAEANEGVGNGAGETPEVGLFRQPVAILSFHLQDRRYLCTVRPVTQATPRTEMPPEDLGRVVHRVARALAKGSDGL